MKKVSASKYGSQGTPSDCQIALRTDHFVDQTFGESNWTVDDERLLASDQSQIDNAS